MMLQLVVKASRMGAVCVLLLSQLFHTAFAQIPSLDFSTSEPTVDFSQLTPEEVDSYLATITDGQARRVLRDQIQAQLVTPLKEESIMEGSFGPQVIMRLQENSEFFVNEFAAILEARNDYPDAIELTSEILFNLHGMDAIPKTILTLLMLLAAGAISVILIFHLLRNSRRKLRQKGDYPIYVRLLRSAMGLSLDGLKIGLFIAVTLPLTFVIYDKFDPLRVLASTLILFIATLWAQRAILREMLFSPVSRDIFIANEQHRKTYYWSMMGSLGVYFLIISSSGLLSLNAFPSELIRLNAIFLVLISISFLLLGVLFDAWKSHRAQNSWRASPNSMIQWHWSALFLLVLLLLLVLKNIIINEPEQGRFSYYTIIMVILIPIYYRVVTLLMAPPQKTLELALEGGIESSTVKMNTKPQPALSSEASLSNFSRWAFGVPYLALIILFLMESLGLGIVSSMGDQGIRFWPSVIRIILAIVSGIIAWNILRNTIQRNMPRISMDPNALMDSEGGGSDAATRTQTLLPILRNVSFFFIIMIVVFFVLSSLGVNTGPLLAGAGVIGIAIGFGAQKLVQDIVSGMFFLFEDAFRIGEYIQAGDMVGTVESTSLRSLKLRHHLGAVQTIPYGEIRAVKNLSRDFIIMKLKFRVPFDTDIEIVRKTIKKVGITLLDHEELGGDFIAPLKSQGVQTAEDDALVIRMKFTCKPGKQWMIKREAYRLVKDALAEKGIHFASRQVTVHIPNQKNMSAEDQQQAAGAAFASIDDKNKTNAPADPLADL